MPDRVTIAETQLQPLKGEWPDVPTYPHVDSDLLYEGDASPFHVTLPIAEIGRVSGNGLEYDTELVTAIAEQMSSGAGGIRGHIPDEQLSTAYPVDDVHWIGHLMQGNTLWAKGYIPPGANREDIRMKKARGGNIATSIFGDAVRELSSGSKGKGKPTWKARNFQLEQIDLAPTKRAALKNRQGFVITREMEGEMPGFENMTLADVPQTIREQIIAETEAAEKLQKVAEMETENAALKAEVAEMRQSASIVAEIRTFIPGNDADLPKRVQEYHTVMNKLAEMLGVKEFANITVRVEEMHEKIAELETTQFEGAVDSKVAELTNWNVTSEANKAKVAAFRKNLRRNVVIELGAERAPEKIAEISQKLWDEEYSVMGAALVAEMGGPAAIVGGKANPTPANGSKTAEQREAEAREKFDLKKPDSKGN